MASSPQEEKYQQQTCDGDADESSLHLPHSVDHSSESQSTHNAVEDTINNSDNTEQTSNKADSNNNNGIFDDFVVRSFCTNSILFFFCIFSFPLWFASVVGDNDLVTAYILSAFGIIIVFNASICGLIIAIFDKFDKIIPAKQIIIYVITALYFFGAFLYFIAACHFAAILNNFGSDIDRDLSSLSGIIWTEMFYISAFSVITGFDLWKRFLNRREYRLYTFCSLYTFCAMVLSFSYLISADIGIANYSVAIYAGICYLFGFVFGAIYLIYCFTAMLIARYNANTSKIEVIKPAVDLTAAMLLFVLMFITCMVYWSAQRKSTQEYMYYFGFGFFILAMSLLISLDIKFWSLIQGFINGKNQHKQPKA